MFFEGSSDHSVGKPAASSADINEFSDGPVRAGQLSRSDASAVVATKISSIPENEQDVREQLFTFDRAAEVIAENSQEGIGKSKRWGDLPQRLVVLRFRFNQRTTKCPQIGCLPTKKDQPRSGSVFRILFLTVFGRKRIASGWGRGKGPIFLLVPLLTFLISSLTFFLLTLTLGEGILVFCDFKLRVKTSEPARSMIAESHRLHMIIAGGRHRDHT
jgi:hypothetical protein